jgi:uncharacterized RDD family membrane protein YckC
LKPGHFVAETDVTVDSEHAYARFTRRVQGVFIDAIIFMLILAVALMLAVWFASDHIARILGVTVAATWLFYEPLLVSLTGGTIGHYLCNMRVVDDDRGNIGFVKAVARMIIKSLLGWYSFLAMAMTSRHQAVHDLLTRSTVQMRDLAKAEPYHFRSRRDPRTPPGMPSQIRRAALIGVYLLVCFLLFSIAMATLAPVGLVSRRCMDGQFCSAAELAILILLWVIWGGMSAWTAFSGWRGQLWGARPHR